MSRCRKSWGSPFTSRSRNARTNWLRGTAPCGARVILGGLHVQSCPEEAARHADAISLGNGVETWPRILRDAETGCLAPVYQGSYDTPFGREPRPRRELVDRASFLTMASLIATRGCANRCGFCYLSTSSVRIAL